MVLPLELETCPSRVEFPLVEATRCTVVVSSSIHRALGLQIQVEDVHHTDLLPLNVELVFHHSTSFVSASFVSYTSMPVAAFVVVGHHAAPLCLDDSVEGKSKCQKIFHSKKSSHNITYRRLWNVFEACIP